MKPAEQRPIPFIRRADLVIEESQFQNQPCWIVKDPLALKYFRLLHAEYLTLQHLNGKRSLQDLKEILQERFPQQVFPLTGLNHLIYGLQRQGLLRTPGNGQGNVLWEANQNLKRRRLLASARSILSLKLPGLNPHRFLNATYPAIGWLFSGWMTILFTILMLSAVVLMVTQGRELVTNLPSFEAFFSGPNLLWMGLLLIFTKVLHELGHAYVSKKFGGQCHEMGVMFLVLMPTLYCNTSDSWILRNKWQRIAIGGAGMYVEAILASICTWLWWLTQPGWLHYTCLNIMFLSGVSTFLFNGNPLLRYDAYYMLADFLEIPNLAQRSRSALLSGVRRLTLGIQEPVKSLVPSRHQFWFAAYSLASFLYRWFVVFSILWMLSRWFQPHGLEIVGQSLILIMVIGMLMPPIYQLYRFFEHPARIKQLKRSRLFICGTLAGLLLLSFMAVPVPYSVSGAFQVKPANAEKVFAKTTGRIVGQPIPMGSPVSRGMELLQLDTTELQLEISRLEQRISRLQRLTEQQRQSLRTRNIGSAELSQYQREYQNSVQQFKETKQRLHATRLEAPCDGYLLPAQPLARTIASTASRPPLELETWWGDPFDPVNLGVTVLEETHLCWVGDPNDWVAEVYIEQSQIQWLKPGQNVTLLLESYPNQSLQGTVTAVSHTPLAQVPPVMASTMGGPLAVKTVSTTEPDLPLFKWYPVSVELDQPTPELLIGLRGQAKIQMEPTPLAQRAYHWINVMLRFR